MSGIVLCHPVWSRSFWLYVVFFLVAIALFIAFAIRMRQIPWKDMVEINLKTKIVKLRGPLVYFVIGFLMVLLILFYSSIDHRLGFDVTQYPQHVDLNVKTSLKTLQNKFEGYSNRVIHLDPAIENLEIEGEYDGKCVADMFYAICLRNPDMLSCDWPWSQPVFYVRSELGTDK